ncbi:MAG TPA: ATP-binding protein [Pyrinomonadaceae bacterium]|jgi:signal transduction histidine kinase/streptogramin lyase
MRFLLNRSKAGLNFVFLAGACLLLLAHAVFAELLPIKTYLSSDGLVYDKLFKAYQDSRGFVWFFTTAGVSRFDGYRFVNYGFENGMEENSFICDGVEDEHGVYWFAANPSGVYRFDPRPAAARADEPEPKNFRLFSVSDAPGANAIRRVFKTSKNEILFGGNGGVYRLVPGENAFEKIDLRLPVAADAPLYAWSIEEDAEGSLWIGHQYGLTRRLPSGAIVNYEVLPQANGADRVYSLAVDTGERIWILTDAGRKALVFNPEPAGSVEADASAKRPLRFLAGAAADPPSGFARLFTGAETLAEDKAITLSATSDGSVWLAAYGKGLIEYAKGEFRLYTKANGLSDTTVRSVTEDSFGNFWIASDWGVMRWNRTNFVAYHTEDGLGDERVCGIFEDRDGALYVTTPFWTINRLDGNRFSSVRLDLPPLAGMNSYIADRILNDRAGEWWFGTNAGLYRYNAVEAFDRLRDARPAKIYTAADGLAGEKIRAVVQDSKSDVWFSYEDKPGFLTRWSRQSGEIRTFSPADGIPDGCVAQTLREDAAGNLYFPCYSENIVVFRNGRFLSFTHEAFDKNFWISDILVDRKGVLWAATPSRGLLKIENLLSGSPQVRVYTHRDGLSSMSGQFLAEDDNGRIYYLNASALDVFEPETERIRKYTLADGLNGMGNGVALRDRRGDLWFGTHRGVSKLTPQPARVPPPPPVFIGALRAGGKPVPVSAVGETNLSGVTLESDARQLQIEFFGLSLSTGESLRYQYKLEGADADWSEPTGERSANYPNVAPGAYRFLVRAVNSAGLASENPAVVSFSVLRPVWQRWWFLALAAVFVSAVVYALYRYRVDQIIKLERVRTRIATDLHDDIGSSLSKIAILSEVVRQKNGSPGGRGGFEPLEIIADTSRQMVDSMSDIVWAINPERDHLSDLVQRMRHFAEEMLDAAGVEYEFADAENLKDISLGADLRREVYLIFKECVNNLAKHSRATRAEIEIKLERDFLIVEISDDGRGFVVETLRAETSSAYAADIGEADAARSFGGNGLRNMRRRAENLGGAFEIDSEPGNGTRIVLKVPVA